MKYPLLTLCISLLTTKVLLSQVIFVGPGGLFQEQNGAITQLATGFVEHNFAAISRDSRFVVFSTPDPFDPQTQLPSSDIYVFDRTAGVTRRLVDHNTISTNGALSTFRPLSAALSPNNQLLAYGVDLVIRQGENVSPGRALNIINAANSAFLAEARGGQTEPSQLEFVGLSWDPGGNSFVTPTAFYNSLPEIVRWAVNGSGQWVPVGRLSQAFNNVVSGTLQIYPAISPSGAGLAYFEVDLSFSGGPTAGVRLYVANADGSNRGLVAFFPSGSFPAGLAWSRDGTQLVHSVGDQFSIPNGGYFSAVDASTAIAAQTPTNGQSAPALIPGIGNTPAIFVSVPTVPLLPLGFTDPNAALKVSLAGDIKKLKKKIKKARKKGSTGKAKKLSKKLKKLKRRLNSL